MNPKTLAGLFAIITVALVVAAWPQAGDTALSAPESAVLGVVEGVTEFLPVSSTGHLTVTEDLMGLTSTPAGKNAADAYAIVIQAGAILAVLLIYRRRIANAIASIVGAGHDTVGGRRLLGALIAGFAPAAIVGYLFDDQITAHLFGVWPVVGAWVVGGIAILAWRRFGGPKPLEGLGIMEGLVIGFAQVLALWPGTSRSLVTILAALALGFTMSAAVEFSFLLGLVTLGAATAYEAIKSGSLITQAYGTAIPALGFVVAMVSAAMAVKWMVAYLQTRSLAIFGWYRIAIAVVVALLAVTGVV